MANEFQTWPILGDFHANIKKELLRRKNQTFGEDNKPRAVWARAVSNAVKIVSVQKKHKTRGGNTVYESSREPEGLRRDVNIMVGGLLLPSGATRGGFEPVYPRVAKGRELRDRPMPGIESISISSKGEYGSLRKITINWLCSSVEDLDHLMPYWLSPGISVVVEWGWSNIGQRPVGIDIDDVGKMAELYQFPAKVMKDIVLRQESNTGDGAGNQDFFIGIITNFTWNMNEDGSFSCTTELTTFGETMLALNLNKDVKKEGVDNVTTKTDKDGNPISPPKTLYGIREFVEKAFNKDNLDNQMSLLDPNTKPWFLDKKSIIKAFDVTTSYGVSLSGLSVPTVTATPVAEGDIYMTWEFIEKRIINDHGCTIVGTNENFFAFEMDSSNTKVSNDGMLYSRNSDILINNNHNPQMIPFNQKPKDYDEKIYGAVDPIMDGFLKNVYVKRSLVVDTFKNSETLDEALQKLLVKVRAAGFDLWDLKIQTDALGESRSKVIDQKYVSNIGFRQVNKLLINKSETDDAIFNFGGYSGKSILRGVSFTSKMTNQIALTHFFGRNKDKAYDKTVYSDDSDIGIKAIYGHTVDRVLMNLRFKEENEKLADNPPSEEEAIEGARVNSLEDEAFFIDGKEPISDEWFYFKDENDIKLVDQHLRRQSKANITKNIPIYPLEISVTIDGISGILPGNVFTLDNLPKAYKENGVFQVVEISHEISSDDWVTTLRAFFRPVNTFDDYGRDKVAPATTFEKETEPEETTPGGDFT
jgi:hypothetical protein